MVCRLLASVYLWVHRRVYQRRLSRARRFPDHCVISIGNLSSGGTGKTPLTIALAEDLRKAGQSVLVCLRGYGGTDRSGVLVADPHGVYRSAAEAGDEAVLIGRRLFQQSVEAGFAVAAGPDRSSLIDRFGKGFSYVLMDDAFQNPAVHRDREIVLMDTSVSPDAMSLLPCGRFREPLSALSRADALVLTRCDGNPENADRYARLIEERWPALSIYRSSLSVRGVIPVDGALGQRRIRPGAEVTAFCGIGNPGAFYRQLEQQGFVCMERHTFADHHRFSLKELEQCARTGRPAITTEKDLVRIASVMNPGNLFENGLYYLHVDFLLQGPGQRNASRPRLLDLLGPLTPSQSRRAAAGGGMGRTLAQGRKDGGSKKGGLTKKRETARKAGTTERRGTAKKAAKRNRKK